jgi:hypothetical protein
MPCLLQTHEPTAMEGAAISAKSCENLLAARCPLLCRFLDAGKNEALGTLS